MEVRRVAKKVRGAMTVEPRSAKPGLSLAEAAQLMKSEDVGSLPVVDDGHLVGVLTDRDIVSGRSPRASIRMRSSSETSPRAAL